MPKKCGRSTGARQATLDGAGVLGRGASAEVAHATVGTSIAGTRTSGSVTAGTFVGAAAGAASLLPWPLWRKRALVLSSSCSLRTRARWCSSL